MDTNGGWSVGTAGPVQQPGCIGVECPICLPFILFSILSSIILWVLVTISSNFKINEVTSRFSDILNIMSQTKVSNKY